MRVRLFSVTLSLTLLACGVAFLSACEPKSANGVTQGSNMATTSAAEGQLQVQDEKVGTGAEAKAGDTVSVNYLGTLTSGQKFDSSYDRNEPFEFRLGSHQVIEGWEKGIMGMREGGKRVLIIPPEMAYGSEGAPPVIPPNATLKFEVELLDVKK